MSCESSDQKSTVALALFTNRYLAVGLLLLLLSVGVALAEPIVPEDLPRKGELVANPQAAYTFAGWDQLGLLMGLKPDSALRLGGFFISEEDLNAA
ncbi:MAG: hypothetical protein ABFD97_23040 [Syntrophobacter sp.]